jgi:hypothetical protein
LHKIGKDLLPCMPEGCVPKVMAHADGPGQLCIEVEPATDRGGYGRDMEAVLHAGADVVIARSEEDLGLVLEPSEGR